MSCLGALQSGFQAAILRGDEDAPSCVADGPSLNAAARFKIYSDAYRLRLAEALSTEYPALRENLGDEAFGALIEAYIEGRPSQYFAAQDYCRGLPDFMQGAEDWEFRREAIDLAAFERALSRAFDAPDAPQLSIEALAAHAPEAWPQLRFGFHPALALLTLCGGTAKSYALACGEAADEPDAEKLAAPRETALFWRQRDLAYYRLIDGDEEIALASAVRGADFAVVCAILAQNHDGEDVASLAAGFLARWFSDGLVSGVSAEGETGFDGEPA